MDIGNSVLIWLACLKLSAGKQPTKFARNLLRAVFTAKELAESSLYGKPCNVKKDMPAKKALDSARLEAVVCKYTMPLSWTGSVQTGTAVEKASKVLIKNQTYTVSPHYYMLKMEVMVK